MMRKRIWLFFTLCLLLACSDTPGQQTYRRVNDGILRRPDTPGTNLFHKIAIRPALQRELENVRWYWLHYAVTIAPFDFSCTEIPAAAELLIPSHMAGRQYISFTADHREQQRIIAPPAELSAEKKPLPAVRKYYLTLDNPGTTIALYDTIESISAPGDILPREIPSDSVCTLYNFLQPGFYKIRNSENPNIPAILNIFVSPIPSVHTDRSDRDWYFTQFRTKTTSNCGPTVVSMGIAWAKGQTVPVSKVRDHIGWQGSGAVSFKQMQEVLDLYGVDSEILEFEGKEQVFSLISEDKLVGIVYNMAGISYQPQPAENLFDQYYIDKGGHYLALKGYSRDKRYFIIYDPIPSDWQTNPGRYSDGVSMYGRNRYYLADEVTASMLSTKILVMRRNKTGAGVVLPSSFSQ